MAMQDIGIVSQQINIYQLQLQRLRSLEKLALDQAELGGIGLEGVDLNQIQSQIGEVEVKFQNALAQKRLLEGQSIPEKVSEGFLQLTGIESIIAKLKAAEAQPAIPQATSQTPLQPLVSQTAQPIASALVTGALNASAYAPTEQQELVNFIRKIALQLQQVLLTCQQAALQEQQQGGFNHPLYVPHLQQLVLYHQNMLFMQLQLAALTQLTQAGVPYSQLQQTLSQFQQQQSLQQQQLQQQQLQLLTQLQIDLQIKQQLFGLALSRQQLVQTYSQQLQQPNNNLGPSQAQLQYELMLLMKLIQEHLTGQSAQHQPVEPQPHQQTQQHQQAGQDLQQFLDRLTGNQAGSSNAPSSSINQPSQRSNSSQSIQQPAQRSQSQSPSPAQNRAANPVTSGPSAGGAGARTGALPHVTPSSTLSSQSTSDHLARPTHSTYRPSPSSGAHSNVTSSSTSAVSSPTHKSTHVTQPRQFSPDRKGKEAPPSSSYARESVPLKKKYGVDSTTVSMNSVTSHVSSTLPSTSSASSLPAKKSVAAMNISKVIFEAPDPTRQRKVDFNMIPSLKMAGSSSLSTPSTTATKIEKSPKPKTVKSPSDTVAIKKRAIDDTEHALPRKNKTTEISSDSSSPLSLSSSSESESSVSSISTFSSSSSSLSSSSSEEVKKKRGRPRKEEKKKKHEKSNKKETRKQKSRKGEREKRKKDKKKMRDEKKARTPKKTETIVSKKLKAAEKKAASKGSKGDEGALPVGTVVSIWYDDKHRYFDGTITEVLSARKEKYEITWVNGRTEQVTLNKADETRDEKNTDRWNIGKNVERKKRQTNAEKQAESDQKKVHVEGSGSEGESGAESGENSLYDSGDDKPKKKRKTEISPMIQQKPLKQKVAMELNSAEYKIGVSESNTAVIMNNASNSNTQQDKTESNDPDSMATDQNKSDTENEPNRPENVIQSDHETNGMEVEENKPAKDLHENSKTTNSLTEQSLPSDIIPSISDGLPLANESSADNTPRNDQIDAATESRPTKS